MSELLNLMKQKAIDFFKDLGTLLLAIVVTQIAWVIMGLIIS